MISNEKIAHDLTIIYLNNRYGLNITGDFSVSDGSGMGDIRTKKLPATEEKNYKKIGTGEKGLFGIEKKQKIEDGYKIDGLFLEILKEYRLAYARFLELLEKE